MSWKVFLMLLAVSLVSQIPSIGAGFMHDFVGWQARYDAGNFSDIIHCFGYHGHHQLLHFVFFSFYKIFHLNGFAWYLFFGALHAVNGYLIYEIVLFFLKKINSKIAFTALAAGVLFILNPYTLEAVVWKACVHYLLSSMAALFIFLCLLRYSKQPDRKHLISAGLAFAASLFALEVSFVTPLFITTAAIILYFSGNTTIKANAFVLFSGTLWFLLAGYLVLNYFTLGSFVGHYGAEVHYQYNFLDVVATEWKYLVKHLFYARHLTFHQKAFVFDDVLSGRALTFILLLIFLSCLIVFMIRIRKWNTLVRASFLLLLGSLIYILPVSNIYFFHLGLGMNDRFSYIPVAFLTVSLVLAISNWKAWIKYILLGGLILLQIFLQQKILSLWKHSTEILVSLKQDFRWHDASHVFVLNSPDNYQGIKIASIIGEPSGIDELIDHHTSKPYDGIMYDVFHFNMNTVHDGVTVEQTGPMQIKVRFKDWGHWWHQDGIGAVSYENEYYKAEILEYPYLLTFKQFPPGSVIIYQDGMLWKEFHLQEYPPVVNE